MTGRSDSRPVFTFRARRCSRNSPLGRSSKPGTGAGCSRRISIQICGLTVGKISGFLALLTGARSAFSLDRRIRSACAEQ